MSMIDRAAERRTVSAVIRPRDNMDGEFRHSVLFWQRTLSVVEKLFEKAREITNEIERNIYRIGNTKT